MLDGAASASPAAVRSVEASYPGCAVISISSLPAKDMHKRVFAEGERQQAFPEIVYSYPIASALRDGLLEALPIEIRRFDEEVSTDLERGPEGWSAVPGVVLRDIADRLARQPKPEPTIILCRDIATGRDVAERQLRAYGDAISERLVRTVSSQDPASRSALDEGFDENAVFIMTPAMANGMDLTRMTLRIVLTALSGSVISTIAIRHPAPDGPVSYQVVDYVGAFNPDILASLVGK